MSVFDTGRQATLICISKRNVFNKIIRFIHFIQNFFEKLFTNLFTAGIQMEISPNADF